MANQTFLRIRAKRPLTHAAGREEITNFIYLRQHLPLPKVGERVTAVSDHNGAEFPGVVIEVDRRQHGFYARINLS